MCMYSYMYSLRLLIHVHPCTHTHTHTHTQSSLSTRIKRLSWTQLSSKVNDLNQSYSFVKMHGPKMKGFAEMAISKAHISPSHLSVSSLVANGNTSRQSGSHVSVNGNGYSRQQSSSSTFALNNGRSSAPTTPLRFNLQVAPTSVPDITVVMDDKSSSTSHSPSPVHIDSLSRCSNIDAVSSQLEPDEAYATASPSHSVSEVEGEYIQRRSRPGSAIFGRQTSRDSFPSVSSLFVGSHHERSRSFSGRVSKDTISTSSSVSNFSSTSAKSKTWMCVFIELCLYCHSFFFYLCLCLFLSVSLSLALSVSVSLSLPPFLPPSLSLQDFLKKGLSECLEGNTCYFLIVCR